MIKQKIFFLISLNIGILFISSASIAWDNEMTHRDLSLQASSFSIVGTSGILEKIGLKGALTEALKLNGKTKQVIEWLQEGAQREDAGTSLQAFSGKARFNNHFHNPLKPWTEAGLDDIIVIPNPYPPFVPVIIRSTGESALLWAQDKVNQQSFSESDSLEGDQAWQTIRYHYYNALTCKTDLSTKKRGQATFEVNYELCRG